MMLHCDGAEFEYNGSLMTIVMHGMLKEGPIVDTSFWLAYCSNNSAAKRQWWNLGGAWGTSTDNSTAKSQYQETDQRGDPLLEEMAKKVGKRSVPLDYWSSRGEF